MMASTLADSASRSPSRLSDNPSKKRLCLQANAATIASTYTYERGETTDIATVALIQQRASVSFEATLQVRNKVLSAYKDIMSMAV